MATALWKDLPDYWWRSQQTAEVLAPHFRRHVVALAVEFEQSGEQKFQLFSGFLIRLWGLSFWFTAGHVIDLLDLMRNDHSVQIQSARWIDGFESRSPTCIPVSVQELPLFSATDRGRDWGAVRLSLQFSELFSQNESLLAFDERSLAGYSSAKPEGYLLLGLPQDHCIPSRSTRDGAVHTVRLDAPLLPVEPVERPSDSTAEEFWATPEAFFGRIVEDEQALSRRVDDIKGMSGGPLFSLERTSDDKLVYRLWGIQSTWLEQRRIICAARFKEIADEILARTAPRSSS